MFFSRSRVVAVTLLILQSTVSIAAPLSDNAIHELEKRITCKTNEVPISTSDNSCVSCASLYKNASTCTRSVPLTCSYGVVTARKCAAADCTKTPGTYLRADGKTCLPCTDGNALTCNSTTLFNCRANYTLFDNECEYGFPYALFPGYGLSKPFAAKQHPFGPFTPDHQNTELSANPHPKARVIVFIGFSFNPATCSGQNGPLDQNLARVTDTSGYVLLKGLCSDVVKSSFISANKAGPACKQVFIPPNDTVN